jgi:hypothetical protein
VARAPWPIQLWLIDAGCELLYPAPTRGPTSPPEHTSVLVRANKHVSPTAFALLTDLTKDADGQRHLLVDVTVTSARTNTNVPCIGARLPLPGMQSCIGSST